MIRVVKPTTPPDVLLTTGATVAVEHCAAHDAAQADYKSGKAKFTFHDVYKDDAVKAALLKVQHGKCAYCESFFKHTGYGDIEHFRPKGAYRRQDGDVQRKPGYFWLAYDWGNLYYSCQLCNEAFKRELFPLRDNRSRAHPRKRDISREKPLLIDPGKTDPAEHITFANEYAEAVNGSREGETTIGVLGLNRTELLEYRRLRLQDVLILRKLCEKLSGLLASEPTPELRTELERYSAELNARSDERAELSAMVRAYLQSPGGE